MKNIYVLAGAVLIALLMLLPLTLSVNHLNAAHPTNLGAQRFLAGVFTHQKTLSGDGAPLPYPRILVADGAPLPYPRILVADGAPLPYPRILVADGAPLPYPRFVEQGYNLMVV
ncbi:MAG: hypothetical protein PVS2B2_02920 [Candidatus Acidiferrum sp.]